MKAPSPGSVMFCGEGGRGGRAQWGPLPTIDRWRGSAAEFDPLRCNLPNLWSCTASRSTYCSLLRKRRCCNSAPLIFRRRGLRQPSNQSLPRAIWCTTDTLNSTEPAELDVTLIAFNCLNSTLQSLFNPHPSSTLALEKHWLCFLQNAAWEADPQFKTFVFSQKLVYHCLRYYHYKSFYTLGCFLCK